jgi:Fe-Mn family superoxide dismutase
MVNKASSRGWALLVYQPLSGKLYNIISDNHANGVLWGTTPIIALDMFEHAYYLDYQNNKTEYIKRFINHIDGQQISQRPAATTRRCCLKVFPPAL